MVVAHALYTVLLCVTMFLSSSLENRAFIFRFFNSNVPACTVSSMFATRRQDLDCVIGYVVNTSGGVVGPIYFRDTLPHMMIEVRSLYQFVASIVNCKIQRS